MFGSLPDAVTQRQITPSKRWADEANDRESGKHPYHVDGGQESVEHQASANQAAGDCPAPFKKKL